VLPFYSDFIKGRDMNSSLSSESPSEGSPLLEDRNHYEAPRNIENEQASDGYTPKALYSDKKLHLLIAAVGIGVRSIPKGLYTCHGLLLTKSSRSTSLPLINF